MKKYRKEVANYKRAKLKLYALIMKYLSNESLDAVQRWSAIEYNAEPEPLWQLV
jgi:hypothetical protein